MNTSPLENACPFLFSSGWAKKYKCIKAAWVYTNAKPKPICIMSKKGSPYSSELRGCLRRVRHVIYGILPHVTSAHTHTHTPAGSYHAVCRSRAGSSGVKLGCVSTNKCVHIHTFRPQAAERGSGHEGRRSDPDATSLSYCVVETHCNGITSVCFI